MFVHRSSGGCRSFAGGEIPVHSSDKGKGHSLHDRPCETLKARPSGTPFHILHISALSDEPQRVSSAPL